MLSLQNIKTNTLDFKLSNSIICHFIYEKKAFKIIFKQDIKYLESNLTKQTKNK